MVDYMKYYSKTYEASRQAFHETVNHYKNMWNDVRIWDAEVVENRFIDFAMFNSIVKKNLLCITSGLHGIEGYVGAAVIRYFVDRFSDVLSPEDTSILLVHAINPYGMAQYERNNEHNVDLNRNFVRSWDNISSNEAYMSARDYFESTTVLGDPLFNKIDFFFTTLGQLIRTKPEVFKNALLRGQYSSPDGLYYGGNGYERSTKLMIESFKNLFEENYNKMVFIDLHTGYGPKDKMLIVSSALEKYSSSKLKNLFSYPEVRKTDKEEFYSINGDMTDYLYHLNRIYAPEKTFYACAFEFGTFGEDLFGLLKSLRNTINARKIKKGLVSPDHLDHYKTEYTQMFYPSDNLWRVDALKQAEKAMKGIFKAFNYIR
ncbi:MAG: M14 family metallopeptidase [Thermotogota bacterium]